jgi:hypothetical protein
MKHAVHIATGTFSLKLLREVNGGLYCINTTNHTAAETVLQCSTRLRHGNTDTCGETRMATDE